MLIEPRVSLNSGSRNDSPSAFEIQWGYSNPAELNAVALSVALQL
jgi:hypothetical protein